MKLTHFTAIAIALSLSTHSALANPAQVYCPPLDAVQCDGKGNCTLDAAYQNDWGALQIHGQPQPTLFFGGIFMQGTTDCMYGSSFGNLVEIYSKRPLSPDTSNSKHWDHSIGVWICDKNGGIVEDCPMLLAQK